jgi:hypothetical protein
MADSHRHPFNWQLFYGPVGGSATIQITDVTEVELPETAFGVSDDTVLTSTGAVEVNSPGWGKPDELTFTCFFLEAQYSALLAVKTGRTIRPWLAQAPPVGSEATGCQFPFNGWLKKLGKMKVKTQTDEKVMIHGTVQMTGVEGFTAGSPAP